LRYWFDWDWMCRALRVAKGHYLQEPIAQFRYHEASKTVGEAGEWFSEKRVVAKRYWPRRIAADAQLAEAVQEILRAETYLLFYSRDRNKALHHLSRAFLHDYHVLKWRRYWLLFLKALLPVRMLHLLRVCLRGF
jgi:hypothetical protein